MGDRVDILGAKGGIRLIASDLDGTLLQDGAQEPRPEVFDLIHELHERGVVFVPASGRTHASLRYLFAPVADELGYVCENGALVMHEGRAVVKRVMDRDLAMDIAHAVIDYPGADAIYSGAEHCYCLADNPAFIDHLRYEVHNDMVVIDAPEDIDEDIIKIAFQTRTAEAQPVAREHFEALFGEKLDVMTSGTTWTDFIGFGSGKGSALVDFGRVLGIAPEEMAAFGDNENDRDMLVRVGHPYLMEKCNPTMLGCSERLQMVATVEDELRRLLAR